MRKDIGPIPVWLLLCLFGLSHATERVCSPALPEIAKSLHLSTDMVQLSSSVYFFGFALGIFTLGRISDFTGRRPIVLLGLAIYCVASIMCGLVTNGYMLLFCRFIQAFGISIGSVLSQAMARDSFEGSKLANTYTSVAISLAFIPSMGLIFGGYIVQYIGWQSNFGLLAIMSVALLMLCFYHLPETSNNIGSAKNFSYFNIFTKVVSDKKVMLYALMVGCVSGMTIGFYVEAPFIFIEYLKLTPSEYGLLGFGVAGANLFGGLINKYLIHKLCDSYKVIASGVIISLIGCIIMFIGSLFLHETASRFYVVFIVVIPTMIHSIGQTFIVPHILHFALIDYRHVSGSVGSIFGACYYLLVAIVNYVISAVHSHGIVAFTTLFLGLGITTAVAFLMLRLIVIEEQSKTTKTNH
jgi:MFS transporter, DHA1 family, multidrug resistance protein